MEQKQKSPDAPWTRQPEQFGGPARPLVDKPDTNSILKRLRKIDPNQARKFKQRSGE
jgi:hypothetical protein